MNDILYSVSGIFGTELFDSVSPGKTTVIRVLMTNTGTYSAESITAQLQTANDFEGVRSDINPKFGNVDNLGIISPGQEFHSTFFLNVDDTVEPGFYLGTVNVNWKQDKNDQFVQAIPITISVSELAFYEKIPYLQIFLIGISAIFLILYIKSRTKPKN